MDRRATSRSHHLHALWKAVLDEPSLPQFDRWLAREMKARRAFGQRDRRWYAEELFSAFRFGYLALLVDEAGARSPSRVVDEAPTRLPTPASLLDAWRGARPASFFERVRARRLYPDGDAEASAVVARFGAELRRSGRPADRMAWASVPHWFVPFLEARRKRSMWTDADLEAFLERHARRPPLWLRLNDASREREVLEELRTAGYDVVQDGRALGVEGARSLFTLEAFARGFVEIQDLASQEIGRSVPARAGQLVWDACAGGGGKTLQLATDPDGVAGRGAVYASDVRTYKLEEVKRRARRAGLANVRTLPWDGEALPAFGLEVHKRGGFHAVLVDAPCSGAGTWRRNPDAMVRFDPERLPTLVALQEKLLGAASGAVRPGGHLVYATCSWLVEENEEVVERFVARFPAFVLVSQALFGNPGRDSDTTFAAVLERKGL